MVGLTSGTSAHGIDTAVGEIIGGLLTDDTLLSWRSWAGLGLETRPVSRHTPVSGAALLALWSQESAILKD